MKVGRLIVNILKLTSIDGTKKRRKTYPPIDKYEGKLNVPYIDDKKHEHTFDIFYAKENRKNCLIFDIHGGGYIFGDHYDNYPFAFEFVKEGYDVVTVDYRLNDGKINIKEQCDDIAECIKYVLTHRKELDIEDEPIAITGDSAGGHFAMLFSEALLDKEFAKELGYEFPKEKVVACLMNCPVYDFAHIGDDNLSNSGMKRMFGPNYKDRKAMELVCPKVHVKSLTCPVFVSTCKHDFLRVQSLMLKEDMKGRDDFEFVDIYVDEKHVGHVHNVLHIGHPLADKVNQAMVAFIDKYLKR